MDLTKYQMFKLGFFAGIGIYLASLVCGLAIGLLSLILR